MTEKRFWSEYYSVGYYTEIVDNEKELEDVPNPKKNLTIEEVVDLMNDLNDKNKELQQKYDKFVKFIRRNHDIGMIHRILKGDAGI